METKPKILVIYETNNQVMPFKVWLNSIKDKLVVARINARLNRVEQGNLGDSKSLGDGLYELRLPFGSGYRIYFGMDDGQIIILLTGGDKSSQEDDIEKARTYLDDYFRRTKNEKV